MMKARIRSARDLEQSWKRRRALEGHHPPLHGRGRHPPARLASRIEHTLARLGAERLWDLLHTEPFVRALGALTGNQAVQMVQAGLKAIYLSGWQVAADANIGRPDVPRPEPLPGDSVPNLVRRINNALQRADQIRPCRGQGRDVHWFAPIVADAEAGFGGTLNAFELMKAMIEAGAARRPLRGPALLREEVRAHGRQGAGAHLGGRAEAGGRPPGGRRAAACRRAHRPHRRRRRHAAHQRHRRARPPLLHRRRTAEGFFRGARRHRHRRSPGRSATRRTPT